MENKETESTQKELVIDKKRVAEEINQTFQQVYEEQYTQFSKTLKKSTDEGIIKIGQETTALVESMRERLLEEVRRGRTIINLGEALSISVGDLDHPEFEAVIKSLHLFGKVMLVGPAGTGKTHMIEQCSTRLDLPFYKYSCSRDSSVHDLLGYKQPTSEEYLETSFLKAYEKGGVFLVDEYDAMSGDMALFFNGIADSSKFISIPHRDINPTAKRHKDFKLVMCGNTWGKGSTEFTGRDFQDGALMDRFRTCRHFIGYNEPLEKNLLGDEYGFGKKLRERLESFNSYLSTRNIKDISICLQNNISKEEIVKMFSQDLTETEAEKLSEAFLPNPTEGYSYATGLSYSTPDIHTREQLIDLMNTPTRYNE